MAKIPKNTKIKTLIYTLSDPDTKEIRYIGKTIKPLKHRLASHIYTSKKKNNHRCSWIKSITNKGKKPIINIIDFCEWDKSQKLEEYWISQFKTWGFNLVNSTDGGEGNLGLKLSTIRKQNLIKVHSKTVYQYDIEGNFIREFNSCQEAANYLNISSNSKIAACARKIRKTCKGFQWSYKKYLIIEKVEDSKHKNKKLSVEHREKAIKNLKGYGIYF
jgi:hypothetical protein